MKKEHRPSGDQPERQSHQYPFSHFAHDLQRRYVNDIAFGVKPPAQEMIGQIGLIRREARSSGSEAAQDAAERIQWAFLAFTYPQQAPLQQRYFIGEYNRFQAEYIQQANPQQEVALQGEETHLFGWMLDQIGIDHDFHEGDISISFAPMEAAMQEVPKTTPRSSLFDSDHEDSPNVSDLMQQWQQQQNENGQG